MSATSCARGGLASCSNRVLGSHTGTDRFEGLPSLRIHFSPYSGLRCLHHFHIPKPSSTPPLSGRRHTPTQASTSRQASKPKPQVVQTDLGDDQPPMSFWEKLVAAFEIFFPPAQVQEAPRQRAKQRLRMILVADRCSVSPTSVSQIKKAIVESLSNFVEIEQEDKVDLSISTDPNLGTIYSVSVPVRRVKPEFDIQTEYENKEFYFDSDGEQIRSFDLTFEELQQEVVTSQDGTNLSATAVQRPPKAGQRRKGPVLPDTLSDGRGPPEGLT